MTMMEFLYFPEDKTEYIPGLITLVVCIILAYVVFVLIRKYSKNEAQRAKEFEEKVMKKIDQDDHDKTYK